MGLLNNDANKTYCTWMAYRRKVESNTGDGLDQLTLPVIASVLGVLPGVMLVISTVIRNEMTVLSMLEFGKMFIGFDAVMLVVSCMMVDRLTWECRYFTDVFHPDGQGCNGGYLKFSLGSTIIFCTNFLLFCATIVWTEIERARERSHRNFGR